MGGKPRARKLEDPCPRMSDDELREFVLAWCDGRIWSDRDVDRHTLLTAFMPIGFMDWKKYDIGNIGLIYGTIGVDRTLQRSVNGCPIFASCRLMHKEDWARAVPAIEAELERRKTIKV